MWLIIYTTYQKFEVGMIFLNKVSYVQQGSISLIKNTVQQQYCEFYYNFE